jgi:hypothetical protein
MIAFFLKKWGYRIHRERVEGWGYAIRVLLIEGESLLARYIIGTKLW